MTSEATSETSEDLQKEWVHPSEAARRLDITERSVYNRVKAGTLTRREEDGRIEVAKLPFLKTEDPSEVKAPLSENVSESPSETSETVSEARALVEQLQGENAWLRGQVEAANVEKAEMRRLMLADRTELQALRQQLAIPPAQEAQIGQTEAKAADLPSGAQTAAGTAQDAQKGRAWWQFWKREES